MSFENISVEKFETLMNEEDAVVIDVRSPQEEVEGKIEDSLLINIMDASFPTEIEKLDKDKTYLVYCRSGNRSATACKFMASKGFSKLYNLEGGIIAWNHSHV